MAGDGGLTEQEVKLTAPDGATLTRLMQDPEVVAAGGGLDWRSRRLESTYLDTPDRALLAHRYGFRFRRKVETNEWLVCLKGEGRLVDGFSSRREWEQKIPAPVDRLSLLPDGPLRKLVLSVAPGGELLVPLVETDFMRRTMMLTLTEHCLVELALDQGEIRAGGKIFPLFEVELEKKSGAVEPVLEFAGRLRQRHGLRASEHSKFAQGLRLLNERLGLFG
ncbi:MAG: CYTH domain-containing protein [Magnetococcales bacterium]|nr:CYTH domain-containing protein [Magnetococcales bacterium]